MAVATSPASVIRRVAVELSLAFVGVRWAPRRRWLLTTGTTCPSMANPLCVFLCFFCVAQDQDFDGASFCPRALAKSLVCKAAFLYLSSASGEEVT